MPPHHAQLFAPPSLYSSFDFEFSLVQQILNTFCLHFLLPSLLPSSSGGSVGEREHGQGWGCGWLGRGCGCGANDGCPAMCSVVFCSAVFLTVPRCYRPSTVSIWWSSRLRRCCCSARTPTLPPCCWRRKTWRPESSSSLPGLCTFQGGFHDGF